MTQTIVALSDTHEATLGNLPAELLQALRQADLIVHAGDHTAMTLAEELRALGGVVAVAGNMDSTAIKVFWVASYRAVSRPGPLSTVRSPMGAERSTAQLAPKSSTRWHRTPSSFWPTTTALA